jgi:hypothetical protein
MPALILALHRDPAQWTALRGALGNVVDAEVIVADTIGATFDVIDARPPDLILVDPLLPPHEADNLTGYLALLPEASHVQTIAVPVISPVTGDDGSREVPRRWAWLRCLLAPNRRSRIAPAVTGWKPEVFAEEVSAYVSLALTLRADRAERDAAQAFRRGNERRRSRRWFAEEASLALPVMVTTDRADLVNISSTGLLLQTDVRPTPGLREWPDGLTRPPVPLTMWSASGGAIHWTGTAVRCRAKSLGDGRFLYEVAFRFDEPLVLPALHRGLPVAELCASMVRQR